MVVLALKKVRKKFTNHGVRKTTVNKLKKANLIYFNFRICRQCQRPQKYKFPQRLRWSRGRRATMTLSCNIQWIIKTPALRKNKYYINSGVSFRHHNNCGSTSHIGDGSVERKQISSFIFGFNSQKFLHESSYDEYILLKKKTGASTDFISNIKNVRIIIIIIIIINNYNYNNNNNNSDDEDDNKISFH